MVVLGVVISVILLSLAGCGQTQIVEETVNQQPEQKDEFRVELEIPDTTTTTQPSQPEQVSQVDDEVTGSSVREIDMVAKKWVFEPNTITVNEGDTVTLHITSIDVDHGISIPTFGVNQKLEPGDEVDVTFVADKKGSFPFICNVFCGSGHTDMTGTLIVE